MGRTERRRVARTPVQIAFRANRGSAVAQKRTRVYTFRVWIALHRDNSGDGPRVVCKPCSGTVISPVRAERVAFRDGITGARTVYPGYLPFSGTGNARRHSGWDVCRRTGLDPARPDLTGRPPWHVKLLRHKAVARIFYRTIVSAPPRFHAGVRIGSNSGFAVRARRSPNVARPNLLTVIMW